MHFLGTRDADDTSDEIHQVAESGGDAACPDETSSIRATIQPHGILVVLREPDLRIDHISENVETLLGVAPTDACGATLEALMSRDDARAFEAKLREPLLIAVNPAALTLQGADGRQLAVECTAYRNERDGLIVEFETVDTFERPAYADVRMPIERLRSAPDVEALFNRAVHDIQALSGFDRVMICRLGSDWEGVIVAEAVAPGRSILYLEQHVRASDVPEATRASYLRNPLRMIPDTGYVPARIVSARANAEPPDLSRATLRGVPPFCLEYLQNRRSRATLTISIVIRGRLWGLVICHHALPRRLNYAQRGMCELLGHILAWQLGIRTEAEQQKLRARTSALADQIGLALDAHADLVTALMACTPHVLELFAADGIAVRIGERLVYSESAPADGARVDAIAAALVAHMAPGAVVCSNNIAALAGELGDAATAGALCIRLSEHMDDYVLLLRPEVIRTVVWSAEPPAQQHSAAQPRTSSLPWREIVRNESLSWTADDITAARSLATRLLAQQQRGAETRTEHITHLNAHLEERNAQAEALIKLQDDVAAALPSRAAVIDVILQFARRQTRATGSVLETLTKHETVFEAATGSLAEHVGLHVPRAGSLSEICVELHQTLVCDDTTSDVEEVDRDVCARLNIGSMLLVPIMISTDSAFVLKVVAARRCAFSDHDTQTLKLAATNLLSALRAAQKFTAMAAAELEQRTYARQLRALHTIASTTTSHRKDQIEAALQLGLEQLGLDWAFLGVIDYASEEFVFDSSVSRVGPVVVPQNTRLPIGTAITGRIPLSKGVLIVDDVAKLSERPLYDGWSSYIAVPLFIGGVNYGAIGFTSRDVRPEPFSEANMEFLAVAGELISSAIERGLQRDQLENSQTRYRALIEAIPQMMWVIDEGNHIEYVNERWTHYTGLTLEQSRAVGLTGVFHATDFGQAALGALLSRAEFDCEVRLRRSDGVYRWHLVRGVPFPNLVGAGKTWLVTATDIEARKSAETVLADVHDAALAATEAKSRFLATMSHEIRTPMNGVIGMTELMLLTPLNDEQREYTEIIRDSGQSLLRVLNDILDYSKIEAGKLELETVQFDLPGQVESVVELLGPSYKGKGVRLATHIDPDVRTAVVGDPGRLRQILLNLAGNALKFTAVGGEVQIVVSTIPAEGDISPVRVTIKDTGIGIPPDVVDRLFQPFSQGDESTTRKFGGTGLGLSISAELVALMGGEIGVMSEPDVGSEFWFVIPFPLAPNSQKVADLRKRLLPRNEPTPMRTERILLVEDNEINTFLALKQLQRLGFAVTSVTNGRQAVETVGRERYDLVLMDCHMPEMDGFEATRAIRKLETGNAPHLPIVAMTADARDEDHQNCLLAGMDDYISKPTNLDSLRAVLERWLPAPERRRASRHGTVPFTSPPTLGMSMLLELFKGDRGAVLDLLAAALGAINVDLKRLEAAANAGDFETVIDAAHRLKGTSGSIRSGRLGEISAAIEAEARTAPPIVSRTLLAELRAAVAAVTAEVQQKAADPTSLR